MFKKAIAFLLICVLSLSLAACSKDNSDTRIPTNDVVSTNPDTDNFANPSDTEQSTSTETNPSTNTDVTAPTDNNVAPPVESTTPPTESTTPPTTESITQTTIPTQPPTEPEITKPQPTTPHPTEPDVTEPPTTEPIEDNAERELASKDIASTDSVVNVIKLAMADQNVYDAILYYTTEGNLSCYIDSLNESTHKNKKEIITQAMGPYQAEYKFNDDARWADKAVYFAAGNMTGVTITLQPVDGQYIFKDAIINKFVADGQVGTNNSTKKMTKDRIADTVAYRQQVPEYLTNGTLSTFAVPNKFSNAYLYNKIWESLGSSINIESQTFMNSEYTIFIHIPSRISEDAPHLNDIEVWGQYNGTNLE